MTGISLLPPLPPPPSSSSAMPLARYLPGQQVADFDMSRHRLNAARLRILPQSMFPAFSSNHATVAPKVAEQRLTPHPITTSSCCASGGSCLSDSSRLCSRTRDIAARRLSRHSSREAL